MGPDQFVCYTCKQDLLLAGNCDLQYKLLNMIMANVIIWLLWSNSTGFTSHNLLFYVMSM